MNDIFKCIDPVNHLYEGYIVKWVAHDMIGFIAPSEGELDSRLHVLFSAEHSYIPPSKIKRQKVLFKLVKVSDIDPSYLVHRAIYVVPLSEEDFMNKPDYMNKSKNSSHNFEI
jgi:hypothetical protein